jgi:hypothetical protein
MVLFVYLAGVSRSTLSVPCRPGIPAYKFQDKIKVRHANHTLPRVINLSMNRTARGSSWAVTCPTAPAPAAQPGTAPGAPRVLWLQLPLPARGSSGAATCPAAPAPAAQPGAVTCPTAPAPATQPGAAPGPSRVLRP